MSSFNVELTNIQGPLSLNINIQGQDYLYFSGTAYLGIPQNSAFIGHYQDGLKKFGLNNGTSRGNNVQLGIYNEAEAYAAEYFGAEAALITSSGYLAAQLLVRAFASEHLIYAPQTHPALWLNGAPETRGGFSAWAKKTVERINGSPQNKWVLISNSLNNLFPEQYDFSFLRDILPENELFLIVDDSHGIGLIDKGRGVLNTIPVLPNVKVTVVASMAKALGIDAGIILGSTGVIGMLKRSNAFLGASPPAAAGLYAFMQAADIYRDELGKLQELMHYFSGKIDSGDWNFIPGYPVYFSQDPELYAMLLEQQILISSFPYPDHKGRPLNRVVLSSWATKESLDRLLSALKPAGPTAFQRGYRADRNAASL
ncbi:aminotransferase class I/II-fold pyridoxal phosphate-dependent enzyme [Pedobacter africanus]|uniref:7-keto-8-aminopelargonate synthetase n=1 Tax=Pedobacter africanus TaxID=151894 RepID=A0A1W2B8M8_9SPHI|nr:aminotransferase class I/II-fold pyridoxal phosphate-dependent enzyme [Pedobacter africanus]SMC69373.1 7-keto-8-aminopelargonate synthetase [Pedobacter africanus]